jgi:hypothetical protein
VRQVKTDSGRSTARTELAVSTPSGRPDFSKADIAMNNGFPKRNVQVSLQSGKTACYWDREAAAGS